ncbi:hypothetical protein KFL_000520270 [Klebsormidium nitens]|uniref:Uncharacterized protein n=1 Tax=Klebsormidium nitens TaxID=105231 RepID=A0A1Y1HNY0_KLENI|nr:hypothetical protein KFL_000520270 [Klebsormidium nitens]|eukprot:GAQ80355.1 hypothetical protein KFL_000520270 [Klebsormidium nitens]
MATSHVRALWKDPVLSPSGQLPSTSCSLDHHTRNVILRRWPAESCPTGCFGSEYGQQWRTKTGVLPKGCGRGTGDCGLRRWRNLASASSDPDSESTGDFASEQLDWRDFRARLVAQQASADENVAEADDIWRARVSKENQELLEKQNPVLAKELPWAHPTGGPEVGGLVLAAHNSPLDQQRFWQAVVFLIEHGPRGSWGLLLNRPSGYTIGQALPRMNQTHGSRLLTVFSVCPIYVGGFKSDGRSLYVLHGHSLPGAEEIAPGVFLGGLDVAATGVLEGKFPPTDFRFFVGRVEWLPGGLKQECTAESWYTAACSKSLVLKQCIQLPKPLWQEILELMGGEFAETSRLAYNESD